MEPQMNANERRYYRFNTEASVLPTTRIVVARKDLPLIRELPPKPPTAPEYLRASAFICGNPILGRMRHERLRILPREIGAAASQGLPQMNPGSGPGQAQMNADVS